MSSEYRNICDICGKETKGFHQSDWRDSEVAKDNWTISISNSWIDEPDDKGLAEWHSERELDFDACRDCSKEAADLLMKWKEERG